MRKTTQIRIFSISLIGAVVLSACGSPAAETSVPIAPSATPAGIATAPPPAVTISSVGAGTPAATEAGVTPTEAAAEEEVADADPLLGPGSYPPGVNPLTGLTVADPEVLNRRPLSIKISNFPRYVRPQAGLGVADIVWEHYSEGGTSRFSAVFFAANAPRVGPIRSARLIDTTLTEMFDGALVTSGSSRGTMERLYRKPWFDLVISEETGYQCPPLCRESEDTNSVFASTEELWNTLQAAGLNAAPQLDGGLAFQRQPPASGRAANLVRVDYSSEAHSEWRYSEVANRYHRWVDVSQTELEPHTDQLDGLHIAVENVVLLFANHVVDFSVPEDFDAGGASSHFATEIQLWLTGAALVFRDGQVYEATWQRMETDEMLSIVDAFGNPLALHPGRTWFHIVGAKSVVSENAPAWTIVHKSPRDFIVQPPTETPAPGTEPAASATPEG